MKLLKGLYISERFYLALTIVVVMMVVGFFKSVYYYIAVPLFFAAVVIFFIDVALLFANRNAIEARRDMMDKLSNGDENDIQILLQSTYRFTVEVKVIDELPFQFQSRDMAFSFSMEAGSKRILAYKVRPTKRGEYHFGGVNVYTRTAMGLVERRFKFSQDHMVRVYPSFIQMRKYELLAISNRLVELGIKKMRKVGHNMEFDQIKEYVPGDDVRTLNWKATARKARLMVNQYQDERSQQVYSVIDMGRTMKMPFDGLSLVDYAINASLVISNIAMHKQDKAGIITFSHKVRNILPASKRNNQLHQILEMLYNQKSGFLETDFERLYATVKQKINQRALLLLYTNFESLSGLKRQLPYLRRIAKDHLLVVVFFENTELRALLDKPVKALDSIYAKTIAEKFAFEKRQIVKELRKYGIHAVLTPPENLTVNTINKYLELKARGAI